MLAKKEMESRFQMSQLPELRQQLAENEQAFIERVQAHPHDFGNAPTTSSSQRKQHFTGMLKQRPGSRSNGKTNPASNNPPIDHLHTERAREEEQMSRSARWNSEHNRTQSQQSRPSKGGFWGLVDRAANSELVITINRTGDAVAHTVADMANPVKQFKTAMTHSGESIESFRSGRIIRGVGYTGLTALVVAGFLILEKLAVSTVQFTTSTVKAVGSKIGFFGGGSAESTVSNSAHFIDPIEVRFSQTTVSKFKTRTDPMTGKTVSYSFDDIVRGMRTEGWQGRPLNVVRMSDGFLTSIDNTRLLAARQAEIKAYIKIHEFDAPISARAAREYSAYGKFEPTTWGEAIHLELKEKIPPEVLYHGTAIRFLESIKQDGLKPGERHHVHLTADLDTANKVGQRYGKPVVLKIKALMMHQQGFKFFITENDVWLTDMVPIKFITLS